ncbi:MAG: hypothetical protein A2X49_11755 [Lentisphaerae bacterium GWF2_52_8]|nr:MAG: hypothetical protein A2X49_11755 [Lentisphaerae bacterium GWF2_52_8]
MFVLRALSSISLTALFLAAVLWKEEEAKILFTACAGLFGFFSVRECLKMFETAGKRSYSLFGALFGAGILMMTLYSPIERVILCGLTLTVLLSWIVILLSKNKMAVLERVLHTLAGIVIIIIPLSFLGAIYTVGEGLDNSGRFFILFLVLVTKSGDIGAYVFGTLSNKLMPGGNHKITPVISPKKSWEGVFGGLLLSLIVAYFLSSLLSENCLIGRLGYAVLMGTLLFVGGFCGDLAESAMKRIVGVKDSGASIPGIGGVMDLLDSLLFNAPLYFCCIQLLHCVNK